eukprot:m.122771 g.122771  ORF g.122771 m.122771 type:complete len:53 (-) comp13434_c0_seq2:989-1147(-)
MVHLDQGKSVILNTCANSTGCGKWVATPVPQCGPLSFQSHVTVNVRTSAYSS